MSEQGQRYLLANLGSLLNIEQQQNLQDQRMVQNIVPACQHILVLQTMELLLELLEEVPSETREQMWSPMEALALKAASPAVKHQAAMTMARLAMADRSQAPIILSGAIQALRRAADELQSRGAYLRAQNESVLKKIATFGVVTIKESELQQVHPLRQAVEARAIQLAAMVSCLKNLPLGLSSQLFRDVLRLVEFLALRPVSSKDPPDIARLASNVLREAGYLLAASLLSSVAWSAIGKAGEETPLYLWRPPLNSDSIRLFESTVKNWIMFPLTNSPDLVRSELTWRANALEALGGWVNGIHASRSDQEASVLFTVPMLQMAINVVPQFNLLLDPLSQTKDEEMQHAACRFQKGLLDTFCGLPDPTAYAGCYKQLLQVCQNRWGSVPLSPLMSVHRLRDLLDR